MEPTTSPGYSNQFNTMIDQQAKLIEQQADILEWYERFYQIGQQMTPVAIGLGLGVLMIGSFFYFLSRGNGA